VAAPAMASSTTLNASSSPGVMAAADQPPGGASYLRR
jgi:hypothetical protein